MRIFSNSCASMDVLTLRFPYRKLDSLTNLILQPALYMMEKPLLSQWIALGDYYLVDVVLDNKDDQMEMSDVHMNYFAVMGS